MNRSAAIRSWLRASTLSPCSLASCARAAASSGRFSGGLPPGTGRLGGSGACEGLTPVGSGITDPRIEYAVQHVGDQVEEDDDRGRDHEPGLDDVDVRAHRAGQPGVEELAEALPAEDDLGDQGAAD